MQKRRLQDRDSDDDVPFFLMNCPLESPDWEQIKQEQKKQRLEWIQQEHKKQRLEDSDADAPYFGQAQV